MRNGVWVWASALMGVLWVSPGLLAAPPGAAAQKAEATAAYGKVAEAYLSSRWDDLTKAERAVHRHATRLTAKQRAGLSYIRKTTAEFRPPWWKTCKSTVPKKIRARIWGRNVVANYLPANQPNMSGKIGAMNRMEITVSWNPSLVDSTTPEKGRTAARHGLTTGDIGEFIVWRQLGYSYITVSLPVKTTFALYNENKHLYLHLQSFYANVTSMYHCSPRARRAAMLMHANAMRGSNSNEAQLRSCRAIAALFAAIVLEDPSKWPSVSLPNSVPDSGVEAKTCLYLYANVEPTWTLAEDKALREALRNFFRANGERALKGRGRLLLPNRTGFMLMEPDDRRFQAKRDAWVKKQLSKAIK